MKHLDVLDLSEEVRDLVRECAAKGTRTVFERNGRPVAVLVSHDEYLALRETIDIANDPLLFARIAEADDEVSQRTAGVPPADVAASRAATPEGAGETPARQPAGTPAFRTLERLVLANSARAGLDATEGVIRRRALSSLARINSDPIAGAPLFEPLKGLWSYRTDELRIIYKIVAEARMVVVLAIDRLRA
ncbi:MAG TPA: type II toxin-antitoxin system Phd/YefM family antitoxin [Thermoanaerobaculia bacterium]|nr:type II toxin-antitoxin system Phd/YefM family antitoxin [Thermoanaerobaculia bacterium]